MIDRALCVYQYHGIDALLLHFVFATCCHDVVYPAQIVNMLTASRITHLELFVSSRFTNFQNFNASSLKLGNFIDDLSDSVLLHSALLQCVVVES